MHEESTEWVIDKGIVKRRRTVTLEATPLTQFLENVTKMTPQDTATPVLPPNTIKYLSKSSDSSYGVAHRFVLFYPTAVRTIYYSGRSGGESRGYNIAFPHLLFRMDFNSSMNITSVHLATCKNRPTRNQEKLYYFRIPNLSGTRVCMSPVSSPGDMAESCMKTADAYFVGQSFNTDWAQYPKSVSNFAGWEKKTADNERFLEDENWDYLSTLGEWVSMSNTR